MTIIRVIDFETTGTEPPAEVCEAAYCDLNLEDKRIYPPVSWLCGVKEMPPEVRAIHHISLAECSGQPSFEPASLTEHAEFSAFCAHNSNFECQFFKPSKPMICTYKAALRVWPDAPSHSNGALRYWLEDAGKTSLVHAQTQPAHRAGPDAYVTAHILLALFDAGATGRHMVSWTREPPLLPRCPIGKFRNKLWSEVEAGFLGWMLRQADMDPGLKWNAQREIDRRSSGVTT